MKFRILKRLSNNIFNKKRIYAFDVETYQEKKVSENGLEYLKQKFLMGSVVGHDIENNIVNEVFWSKKQMQKFLMSTLTRNSLLFATNLDFDFKMLFNDYNLKDFNFIDRNGSSIIITYRKKLEDRKNYNEWKFLDTLNYSRFGVKALGKYFSKEKLELPECLGQWPKNNKEKQQLEEYNVRDSLITFEFANFIQKFCNSMKCKLKPTIASIGIDYWRRNHLKTDIFQERRHIIEKHYQGSIKGGRTEVFKRGLFNDVYYYDFNSMYPSVCRDGIDGAGSYPLPSSVRTVDDSCYDYIENYEGISKIRIISPDTYVPLLGVHDKEGKLFFPKGSIKGWWTHIEIREAVKEGYEIKEIYQTVYYDKLFIPFKECVKTLYDLRISYKKEKNRPMADLIKTLMNGGLFGKFAQKINNKTECYHIKNFYVDKSGETYVMLNGKKIILYNFNIRGDYVFENIEIPAKIPIFIMPILASYTTGMARIKLFRYLKKYSENLIYCDTDSLTLKKSINENSSVLGELKLEHVLKEAIFIKPKQYYYITDKDEEFIKMKGVIKKCIKGKDDFFKSEFEYIRFTKTKESAVRKIPYGSIINVIKHVKLEDDKRIWEQKFSFTDVQDSRPLRIIDDMSEIDWKKEQVKKNEQAIRI